MGDDACTSFPKETFTAKTATYLCIICPAFAGSPPRTFEGSSDPSRIILSISDRRPAYLSHALRFRDIRPTSAGFTPGGLLPCPRACRRSAGAFRLLDGSASCRTFAGDGVYFLQEHADRVALGGVQHLDLRGLSGSAPSPSPWCCKTTSPSRMKKTCGT